MNGPRQLRLDMRLRLASAIAVGALAVAACTGTGASAPPAGPSVVVTYSVLGAVVTDLVGDRADVTVLMGNGVDPHDWSPSAKDIERVMKADVVVANGLGLEEGLEKTLDEAEKAGVAVFHATDHITVREVGDAEPGGEGERAPERSLREPDEHDTHGRGSALLGRPDLDAGRRRGPDAGAREGRHRRRGPWRRPGDAAHRSRRGDAGHAGRRAGSTAASS